MKKWFSILAALTILFSCFSVALAQEDEFITVDYQTHFIRWDGVTTDKDFTEESFAALTQTTVYRSEESPTGYMVTFRFYGPEYETVEVAGEWYYSEPFYSSQNSAARIHPTQWYNGCMIHTDDVNPVRPFDQMTLNEDTGYWFYTMPLASGTYCYQFRLNGKQTISDPQNLPTEYRGKEAFSQVLVPYDAEKQSLSPNYALYQDNCEQRGSIQFAEVPSATLGYDAPIGIYLPYGYDANRAEGYKYVILGHGIAGFESNWTSQGMLGNITDNLIAQGLVEPMIVITPNNRDNEGIYLYSTVNADGSRITEIDGEPVSNKETSSNPSYSKQISQAQPYFMDELIPWLEAHLNVSHEAKDRAFSGLSAGAMCTFNMFISNPEDFGYFYMMSGANADPTQYDLSRDVLKTPSVTMGVGIYDRLFFSQVNPTQTALAANDISFTNYYAFGAHRWHVWRELYIDMCTRVLWK